MTTVVKLSANPLSHPAADPAQADQQGPVTEPGLPGEHYTATGAPRVERSTVHRSTARHGSSRAVESRAADPRGGDGRGNDGRGNDVRGSEARGIGAHSADSRPFESRAGDITPPLTAAPEERAKHSAFVPMILGGMALLGSMAFQGYQHLGDRQTLQNAHAAQQQTVDNAGKLRASLDALAADTQRMADAGNASARLLVEELKKRGVTINATATAGATPTAAPGTAPR